MHLGVPCVYVYSSILAYDHEIMAVRSALIHCIIVQYSIYDRHKLLSFEQIGVIQCISALL